jgi:hypothetical protein
LEELILTRADPRSVLFELKPSTPLESGGFPTKIQISNMQKKNAPSKSPCPFQTVFEASKDLAQANPEFGNMISNKLQHRNENETFSKEHESLKMLNMENVPLLF